MLLPTAKTSSEAIVPEHCDDCQSIKMPMSCGAQRPAGRQFTLLL